MRSTRFAAVASLVSVFTQAVTSSLELIAPFTNLPICKIALPDFCTSDTSNTNLRLQVCLYPQLVHQTLHKKEFGLILLQLHHCYQAY